MHPALLTPRTGSYVYWNTILIEIIVKLIVNEREICHYCLHSSIKICNLHPNDSLFVQMNVRINFIQNENKANMMIVFSC